MLSLTRAWASTAPAFSPRNVPQFVEIANFLSARQRAAAHRDRHCGAFERLPHLRLQRRDVALKHRDVVLQSADIRNVDLAAARLPLASDVTSDTGPVCAARLAADVMPGILYVLVAVPTTTWLARSSPRRPIAAELAKVADAPLPMAPALLPVAMHASP